LNEEAIITQQLPSIRDIEKYTVDVLKKDLEENYLIENNTIEMTVDSPLYHVVVMLTYKYLKNNKINLEGFSEFDEEDSGIRLGNILINQKCLFGIQTALLRRFLKKTNNQKTTFGFKSVLDRYSDLKMTVEQKGGIGAGFMTEIRNAIIDESRQSSYKDLSQNLYTRFKTILNSEEFNYQDSSKLYSLKNPKACDALENLETIRKAVNSVTPWYGTENIYTTKAIKKILLLAHCVDRNLETSFQEVFSYVKDKVRDWLINNPDQLSSMSRTKDEEPQGSAGEDIGRFKTGGNYVPQNKENLETSLLDIEYLAKEYLDSLSDNDYIITELLFGYKSRDQVQELLDIGENMTYKLASESKKNISEFFSENKIEMEEGEKLMLTISSFLKHSIV
jgi:hypothetical protein